MSLFAISSVITAIASVGFGLSVYASNSTSRPNRWWLALSIVIALWAVALYGVTNSSTEAAAALWQYPLDAFGILIPLCYLFFVLSFIGRSLRPWYPMLLLAIIEIYLSTTSLYRLGMGTKFGFFWINPGPLYLSFPIFFTAIIAIGFVILIVEFRRSSDKIFRAEIRNQLLAGLIGFGGGMTNFFPQLFNVYPFGNYFVILYVFLISYGVLRYKYLSPKIISAQLFSGAVGLIFLFNLLQSQSVGDWLLHFLLFGLVAFFSIFLVRGVYKEVEQREIIEKQNEEKSEFMSFASHEIRNPITAIRGYASMLVEGDYGPLTPQVHDVAERMMVSGSEVISLISQFLNKSKLELGQLTYNIAPLDLTAVVRSTAKDFELNASERKLSLTALSPSQPLLALGDSAKVKEALGILIDNSLKYTKEGGITISAGQSANDAQLVVSDTGAGIPPQTIPNLFQKFSRADAKKMNLLGTGLGLFLAKTYVEAMGGKIWAESAGEGKGSKFIIELPMAPGGNIPPNPKLPK